MTEILKTAASLSVSGTLVILVLLLCKPLLQNRTSKRWQYYIWLAAIARLLLPLSPEASPVGRLFQEPQAQYAVQSAAPPQPAGTSKTDAGGGEAAPAPQETRQAPSAPEPAAAANVSLPQTLCLIWLAGALLLLVRKVTAYQSFVRCIRAGCREVSQPALLDRLAQLGEQAGVRRPVELSENPLAASPMLLGVLRPQIVLPSAELTEEDFRYTVLHELTHCKRWDLAYKWLVQAAVCLHWFNPMVFLMEREISRACELACDEAVLGMLETEERRAYGGTLLRALETGGGYKSPLGSVTLGESAELLKERLTAIMKFKKQSKLTAALSLILAAALATGAAAAGAYTGPAKPGGSPSSENAKISAERDENIRLRAAALTAKFYEEGDIASFSIAFSFLDEASQEAYLERCCADGNIAFFASCLSRIDPDSALINAFAERAYEDGNLSFFSTLAGYMDEKTLESWMERISEDGSAAFLSVLLRQAERDGELDALEEELEAKRLEEYKGCGITKDGAAYYYNGQMVHIFLDARPDRSFITLDMNPLGEVDVKVTRNRDGKIESVAYMTETEVSELLGSPDDPDDEPHQTAEMETLEFKGTAYYLVCNEAQLRAIGSGEYGLDKHYMQQDDIQLSSKEWIPIGSEEHPFTGSYNGNGFEITGLTMKDPDALYSGLFGVAKGAKIYNITLRDYDIKSAGRNAAEGVSGPILALGLEGSRCFDNFIIPQESGGGAALTIPVDLKRVEAGAYCWLGEYTLSPGDRVRYDVSAQTGNGLAIGFAAVGEDPGNRTYLTVSNKRTDGMLQCSTDFITVESPVAQGRYRLFLRAADGALGAVSGEITLALSSGSKDLPGDVLSLSGDELPAAAQKAMEQCDIRTWYVVHSEGRQYLSCRRFPWSFAYHPVWEDGGWHVEIKKYQKQDSNSLLLSFPDSGPLTVDVDGEAIRLTEIREYS